MVCAAERAELEKASELLSRKGNQLMCKTNRVEVPLCIERFLVAGLRPLS
jgi:hypothetical protein